jgi:hypothetical protein
MPEHVRIRAIDVDDFCPARGPSEQRDRAGVDAERRSHRSDSGRGGPAFYCAGANTDYEGAVVIATHAGVCRAGPNPDGDAQWTPTTDLTSANSLPASAVDARLAAVMLPVVTALTGTG